MAKQQVEEVKAVENENEIEPEIEDYDVDAKVKNAKRYDVRGKVLPEEEPNDLVPKNVNSIYSVISNDVPSSGLRARKGYHQTWKRGDEFEEALGFGYSQIRKQKRGENRPAGQEQGVVLVRHEGEGQDLVGMEIPEWAYLQHLAAKSAESHRLYTDPDLVLSEFSAKTNRDLSSKKEQVHMSVTYDEQEEEIVRGRKTKAG